MLRTIQIEVNENKNHEWAILEFQGELKNSMSDAEIGNIEIKGNTASMVIGQHALRGKIENLPNPLLVVEKPKKMVTGLELDKENAAADEDEIGTTATGSMEIQGVIRKRVIFTARPKPLL